MTLNAAAGALVADGAPSDITHTTTTTGSGALSFAQKYASAFSGQVTDSTLGLISIIGLADEVLYFFLVPPGIDAGDGSGDSWNKHRSG